VLLTNLANRVQPFIRYDLGDSITVKLEGCECGSRLPAIRVEGRQDDVLYLETPGREKTPILPLALATVVEETPGVHRFQVIQTGPASVRIRLEVVPGTDEAQVWEALASGVQQYLAAQGAPMVRIERAPEPPQRDPVGGKFRQVWAEEM